MPQQLLEPFVALDRHELAIAIAHTGIQACPFQVSSARHPTEHTFSRTRSSTAAIDHPLQHAHVFSVTRPKKLAVAVAPEPVHREDAWWVRDAATHLQPVIEVVAHVIAAKR